MSSRSDTLLDSAGISFSFRPLGAARAVTCGPVKLCLSFKVAASIEAAYVKRSL